MRQMNEHQSYESGIFQLASGKHLFINPRTRAVEASSEAATLFSVLADGTLVLGTSVIEPEFRQAQSNRALTLDQNGFKLVVAVNPDSTVTFRRSGETVTYTFVEAPGGATLHFTAGVEAPQGSTLSFVSKTPRGLSRTRGCCGVRQLPPKVASLWNDLGHKSLVQLAIEYLKRDASVRLADVWTHPAFLDALFKGLHDADYVSPYNDGGVLEGAWRSHFFDPDTETNYRGEKERTAYTEGMKYFNLSFQEPRVAEVGFKLGLALHYFTDLTQPFHAANFAEVYASHYPTMGCVTRVHSFFEEIGDEVMKGSSARVSTGFQLSNHTSAEQLLKGTAHRSKTIYQDMLAGYAQTDLVAGYPRMEEVVTHLDDLLYWQSSTIHQEHENAVAKLHAFLLPFAREALCAGLEQTIQFLNHWNTEYLEAPRKLSYYIKIWQVEHNTSSERWLGYFGVEDGGSAAQVVNIDPSRSPRSLALEFVDAQGQPHDPTQATGVALYLRATKGFDEPRVLAGKQSHGHVCNWAQEEGGVDPGYALTIRPSTIIKGKWEICRAEDNAPITASNATALHYDTTTPTSLTMEFTRV